MAPLPSMQGEKLKKKKNRYKLDKKADVASRKVVLEAVVQYDIEQDEFKSMVAVRRDVEDDELMVRIGRQVEGAIRKVMPAYEEEMNLIESLARLGSGITSCDSDCDCVTSS